MNRYLKSGPDRRCPRQLTGPLRLLVRRNRIGRDWFSIGLEANVDGRLRVACRGNQYPCGVQMTMACESHLIRRPGLLWKSFAGFADSFAHLNFAIPISVRTAKEEEKVVYW